MLSLEVGKTYLRATAENTVRILGSFDLVKILGKVDEDTKEYVSGERFFGDDEQYYTETGQKTYKSSQPRNSKSWNGKPTWNDRRDRFSGSSHDFSLAREATAEDFSQGFTEKLWISSAERLNTDKYISSGDSRFVMILGGVYVDRMGFVRLITSISYESHRDYARFSPAKGRGGYLNTGKTVNGSNSMLDIAFQRI